MNLLPHFLCEITNGLRIEPSFKCHPIDKSAEVPFLVDECFDNSPQKCRFVYDAGVNSIANEFNLVCNEKYKVALVQSVWMAGVMTGALVLGGLADMIGRLKTLMLSILGTILFETFSAFASSYYIFIALRFVGGICCSLVILVSFVLSQELVGTSKRSICGVIMSISFSIGIALLSAIASRVHDWRLLGIVTSLSGLVFIALPFYVPESPRWLLSQGKTLEAKFILENIAKRNGTLSNLPHTWELAYEKPTKDEEKGSGIKDILNYPYILILMLIQIFSWFVNSATYYALTMAASDLGGNVYISTALNGLVEIPACLIAIAVIDKLGRKIAICSFMFLGGTACICIQFIPSSFVVCITSFALVGKLSIAGSFAVIYIHSGEIFPTVIRNTCMGIVSVAARVGGIVSPFILMLGDVYPCLHFTFLGILAFAAGFLNTKLPETLGRPMPESIHDILAFKNSNIEKKTVKKAKYAKLINEVDESESFIKD